MTPIILPYKGILPTIDETAYIAPGATVVGDVVIGAQSSIWFSTVVRGDVHEIRIGARTNIQDGSVVHVTTDKYGTYIGDGVTVGHGVILHACTLEDDCFVGMGATVMDGAVVESGAMVAAGALVTPGKRVPKGELWSGAPARIMRALTEEEQADFARSSEHYVRVMSEYL